MNLYSNLPELLVFYRRYPRVLGPSKPKLLGWGADDEFRLKKGDPERAWEQGSRAVNILPSSRVIVALDIELIAARETAYYPTVLPTSVPL
jgi:hypothetical protein